MSSLKRAREIGHRPYSLGLLVAQRRSSLQKLPGSHVFPSDEHAVPGV